MPGTYLPKKVVDAVNILNDFVKDREKKQTCASEYRHGDWDDRSSRDRAYYYENQRIAVNKLLRGVAVEAKISKKTQKINGIKVF